MNTYETIRAFLLDCVEATKDFEPEESDLCFEQSEGRFSLMDNGDCIFSVNFNE